MSDSVSSRTYRAAPWLLALVVVGLIGFGVATWFMHRTQGWSLTTLGLAFGSIMTLVGLADTLMARVVLLPDAIEWFGKFRKRRIPRADIANMSAEKGAPLMLELKEGGWVKLPELGGSLHPNTLRAWLKREQRRLMA